MFGCACLGLSVGGCGCFLRFYFVISFSLRISSFFCISTFYFFHAIPFLADKWTLRWRRRLPFRDEEFLVGIKNPRQRSTIGISHVNWKCQPFIFCIAYLQVMWNEKENVKRKSVSISKPDFHPLKILYCVWWEMKIIIHYDLPAHDRHLLAID